MNKKKIKIRWSCINHHEHKYRITANVCIKLQLMKRKIKNKKPWISLKLGRFNFGIGWYHGEDITLLEIWLPFKRLAFSYTVIFYIKILKFVVSLGYDGL